MPSCPVAHVSQPSNLDSVSGPFQLKSRLIREHCSIKEYQEKTAYERASKAIALLASIPATFPASKDSQIPKEWCEAANLLIQSINYTPKESIRSMLFKNPDSIQPSVLYRISLTVHALVSILASFELEMDNAYPLDAIPALKPIISLQTNAQLLSKPMPSFNVLTEAGLMKMKKHPPALKSLFRILVGIEADLSKIVHFPINFKLEGGYPELDFHWFLVLGTCHLFSSKLNDWLRTVFDRMRDRPLPKGNRSNHGDRNWKVAGGAISGNSSPFLFGSSLASASTEGEHAWNNPQRRITPTLLDVETFLLFMIVMNYIHCVLEHGAGSISQVVFLTFQKAWKPHNVMVKFWNTLVTQFSSGRSTEKYQEDLLSPGQVTKFVRDLRNIQDFGLPNTTTESDIASSAFRFVALHIACIYGTRALEGLQDCGLVAKSLLRNTLSDSREFSPSTGGFIESALEDLEPLAICADWIESLGHVCQRFLAEFEVASSISPEKVKSLKDQVVPTESKNEGTGTSEANPSPGASIFLPSPLQKTKNSSTGRNLTSPILRATDDFRVLSNTGTPLAKPGSLMTTPTVISGAFQDGYPKDNILETPIRAVKNVLDLAKNEEQVSKWPADAAAIVSLLSLKAAGESPLRNDIPPSKVLDEIMDEIGSWTSGSLASASKLFGGSKTTAPQTLEDLPGNGNSWSMETAISLEELRLCPYSVGSVLGGTKEADEYGDSLSQLLRVPLPPVRDFSWIQFEELEVGCQIESGLENVDLCMSRRERLLLRLTK